METCAAAVGEAALALAAAGIDLPRLEARLLVAHVLGLPAATVAAAAGPAPDDEQRKRLDTLIADRTGRVPLAYLLGVREFYGLEFMVSSAVLVPRPETEMLVEFSLLTLEQEPGDPIVVDIGAGSGCIPISILANSPKSRAVAVDVSAEALCVARSNALRHQVDDRLRFIRADLLSSLRGKVSIVTSNPPYIPNADIDGLQPEVSRFEPRIALDGGADGLKLIRLIIRDSLKLLLPGGWLVLECGRGQAGVVVELCDAAGYNEILIQPDMAGIERMVCARS